MPGILQERANQKKAVPESNNSEKEQEIFQEQVKTNKHFQYDVPNEKSDIGSENEYLTEEDVEQLNRLDQMMDEENFIEEKKKRKILRRISVILLTAACTYLVVLIYGSFITEFYYNDKGEVAPVVMSVSDISNKNEYNSIIGMYLQTRNLYEKLLTLDYRMAAGTEDSMAIAPEYEETLDTVSTLTTQIDAAVINSKYTQVKNMLLTWVKTHAAAYCQYMSTAIAQNDSNAASEAIAARQVLNSNFQLITQNIITLGGEIKGYDLSDIEAWSPDGFVQETIEGIQSDNQAETKENSWSNTDSGLQQSVTDTETSTELSSDSNIPDSAAEQNVNPQEAFQSDFSLQGGGNNG